MTAESSAPTFSRKHLRIKVALLAAWALASFGACFFARDLDAVIAGWPFNYWFAAQGAVMVFIAIVVCYAWTINAMERRQQQEDGDIGGDTRGG